VKLRVETIPVDALTLHPRNPRQGDVGAISESLAAFGQYAPIVVQKSSGHVIAGNHRLLAARALGWKDIQVVRVDVDDQTAERILVADNRTADLATNDDAALTALLADLAARGDLTGTAPRGPRPRGANTTRCRRRTGPPRYPRNETRRRHHPRQAHPRLRRRIRPSRG
jgi:ParB-like chromosome segregation protein Spo0J